MCYCLVLDCWDSWIGFRVVISIAWCLILEEFVVGHWIFLQYFSLKFQLKVDISLLFLSLEVFVNVMYLTGICELELGLWFEFIDDCFVCFEFDCYVLISSFSSLLKSFGGSFLCLTFVFFLLLKFCWGFVKLICFGLVVCELGLGFLFLFLYYLIGAMPTL